MNSVPSNILDGVDAEIESLIFNEEQRREGFTLKQKRSFIALSETPPNDFDGYRLVQAAYACIENNLMLRPNRDPSQENWKLRPTDDPSKIRTSRENRSPEVTLERAIVLKWPTEWTYQMPTASGLFDGYGGKHRNIDLVRKEAIDSFNFVELKWESNNPLFAALEILGYGLVYLASRTDPAGNLNYGKGSPRPVLTAKKISLSVLAPFEYYEGCRLDWLERGLDSGLKELVKSKCDDDLEMDFRFEHFPDGLVWRRDSADLPERLSRERLYS